MRRATFDLFPLNERSEDGRLIRSLTVEPKDFPLPIIRSTDDPLRYEHPAGQIERLVLGELADGTTMVVGLGGIADDLARDIIDRVNLYAEADCRCDLPETHFDDEGNPHIDMDVMLRGATIGEVPAFAIRPIRLGP